MAKAAPDGYTLLAGSSGSLTAMEAVSKSLQYDVLRDFTPAARMNVTPMAVVVGPGTTAKTLAELAAQAREKHGSIGVASAGLGTSNQSSLWAALKLIGAPAHKLAPGWLFDGMRRTS